MKVVADIFRAYDIRGLVGEQISETMAEHLGRALASVAREEGCTSFCVGYDGRHSSRPLAQALHKGLLASGCDVIDVGLVPTPLLYFSTQYFSTGCGVMITGSHNPPQYNGFKMMLAGKTLALDEITNLHQRIEAEDYAKGQRQGQFRQESVQEPYIKAVSAVHPTEADSTIVIDAGNGAAGEIAPLLFQSLGYTVIPLFCEIDGDFPNHHPDPGNPENLRDLQRAVVDCGATVGLAFDGDGDRLGIVTESGDITYPDKAMMLYAEDMLRRQPGAKVIVDVKSSPLVVRHIESCGGEALVWKTGHSLIKRKMKETGALLAGEMSGHIFFAEQWYGFDDALLAGVRLLAILQQQDQSLGALFSALPGWTGTPEINLLTTDSEKFTIVDRLIERGDFGDGNRLLVDGLRIEYPWGWGLVRCSNTTPMLVLRFEGENKPALERIISIFSQEISRLAPELDLNQLHQFYG